MVITVYPTVTMSHLTIISIPFDPFVPNVPLIDLPLQRPYKYYNEPTPYIKCASPDSSTVATARQQHIHSVATATGKTAVQSSPTTRLSTTRQ